MDWLRGIPCSAPCYAGITPGHSTIAEARVILEHNPRVGALVDRYGVVEWGWNNLDLIGGGGTQGEPTEGGGVFFGPPGSTEQSPVLAIGPKLDPVPFAEIVRVFGTPSDVLATLTEAPTEDVGTPDFQPGTIAAYALGFLYRQQGIFFYADVPLQEKPVLTSTLMLLSPTFFDPTAQFTQHLQLEPMVPWQGWQSFDVYCRTLSGSPPFNHVRI
jgi:hypothetical protein